MRYESRVERGIGWPRIDETVSRRQIENLNINPKYYTQELRIIGITPEMVKKYGNVLLLASSSAEVLRKPVKRVESPENLSFETVRDMITTIEWYKLVGLAANQVGINERFFVMRADKTKLHPNVKFSSYSIAVNPEILKSSSNRTLFLGEQCMTVNNSFPTKRGKRERMTGTTLRPEWLKVRYVDWPSGNEIETVIRDELAAIFEHEFEHLHGKLFLERLADPNQALLPSEIYVKLYQDKVSSR